MTALDETSIRAQVERALPALEHSADDELLAAIGSIPFNPAFSAVPAPQEFLGFGAPNFGLKRVGEAFLKANDRVRGAVCANKAAFDGIIDAGNVTNLLLVILPALGMTGVGAPPGAAIALAVFILRIGLNEYCKSEEGA